MPYIMPLDHCKCYAWTCINFEKVKDAWVKDERKIDGYAVERRKCREKQPEGIGALDRGTHRQQGRRWSESQRQKKERWRELKKPQQKPKAH